MLLAIWFGLWGVLWAAYFVLDGFDLGAGALLPAVARDEKEREEVHRAIGPYWDGNEVWLIAAGGVTFAAFPTAYAVMFSALYAPLMFVLFALILRGASIGLRSESETRTVKKIWDMVFAGSSLAAALLFGVAFANIFRGIPIDRAGVFQGSLLGLLNPYGLIGGGLFAAAFLAHGALWLAGKAEGEVELRAARLALPAWAATLALALAFLAASWAFTDLFDNYRQTPVLFAIPALAVTALLAAGVFIIKKSYQKAWAASSLFIAAAVFFGLAGMYPALLPSSLDPAFSMTTANSASGPLTLKIMLGVTLVFVPLVIAYQTWVYLIFKGKAGGWGDGY